jgi:hypothetical protein
MERWLFGLDSWIIQDGNYADFRVGQTAQFALEFGTKGSMVASQAKPRAELRPVRWAASDTASESVAGDGAWVVDDPPTYDFVARVVHREPWVIDFGLRAYTEHLEEPLGEEGTVVSFSGYLGVDPFMYFERLAEDEKIPPLIYTWRIDRIGRETAPWIEREPRYFVRDRSKSAFVEVQETNAWEDDGGHAAYVLECVLVDPQPGRRSTSAAYP